MITERLLAFDRSAAIANPDAPPPIIAISLIRLLYIL
jgi:hypothetical protein